MQTADRLRNLRLLKGLSQEDLSRASGLPQSTISKLETGQLEMKDDMVAAVCRATQTSQSFFGARRDEVPHGSLQFRRTSSVIAERRVNAFFSETYCVADDLLQRARVPIGELPEVDVDDVVTDEAIEDAAQRTRAALGIADDVPIPHLTRLLERAGVAVTPMFLGDPSDAHSDPDSALGSSRATGHLGISYRGSSERSLIATFGGQPGDRLRFTLAHELGHLVLHTFRFGARDPEGEANRFASALLVPRQRAMEMLDPRLHLQDYVGLKATWGMSIAALIVRGRQLGLLDQTRVRSLFVTLSRVGWRKQEPGHVAPEEPLLLRRAIERVFPGRPLHTVAVELNTTPEVIRSLSACPPTGALGNVVDVDFARRSAST